MQNLDDMPLRISNVVCCFVLYELKLLILSRWSQDRRARVQTTS